MVDIELIYNALKELDHVKNMYLEKADKAIIYEVYGDVLISFGRVNESKDAYVRPGGSLAQGNF